MDSKQRRVMIPLVVVVVVLIIAVVGLVIALQGRNAEPAQGPEEDSGGSLVLDYAQGVTVVDDESSLQAAVDKMFQDAENEMIASYQGQAASEDGKTFSCYIANSEYNEYDMFIALYDDPKMESDPIFLSGLMRPGEAFREITLEDALDKGSHTVNLVFTQVEDDHATIHGQSIVTIQMDVS